METDPRGLEHSRHHNNPPPPTQGRPDDKSRARRDRETAETIRRHKDNVKAMLERLRELRGGLDKQQEKNAETMVSLALALATKDDALNEVLIEESKADTDNSKIMVWINQKDFNKVIMKDIITEEQPK